MFPATPIRYLCGMEKNSRLTSMLMIARVADPMYDRIAGVISDRPPGIPARGAFGVATIGTTPSGLGDADAIDHDAPAPLRTSSTTACGSHSVACCTSCTVIA